MVFCIWASIFVRSLSHAPIHALNVEAQARINNITQTGFASKKLLVLCRVMCSVLKLGKLRPDFLTLLILIVQDDDRVL